MKAEIIKIGNSRGLRIPNAILKQCGMQTTVNLKVEDHKIIITPFEEARAGWAEEFQAMAINKDDALLDNNNIENLWDRKEWQW